MIAKLIHIFTIIIIMSIFCFGLSTCIPENTGVIVKIEFIRVFMHEPHHYSILSEKNTELQEIEIDCYGDRPRIFKDILDNEPMYLTAKLFRAKNWMYPTDRYLNVEIHIHSEKDMNGAGWNHGKFGKGDTTILEW